MILAALLLACTPDDPSDTAGDTATTDTAACVPGETTLDAACACATPTIEVGNGSTTFQTVTEGALATMVHGPQGGWHIEAAVRTGNMVPIISIRYTIDTVPEGVRVSDNAYRVQVLPEGDCGGYYPGMYGYLQFSELASGEADTPPELLGGKGLLLTMEVTDFEGRTASDTLTVTAALDPIDEGMR